MRVLGALDGHGEHGVVAEELDRALGASLRVRDKDHRLAALTSALDLGDPILEAPSELERGLSRDVSAGVLSERECLQRGSRVEPRGHDSPVNDAANQGPARADRA